MADRGATEQDVGAYALKVWRYKQGEFVSLMLHLGDRLGLFAAMADGRPVTSAVLADRAGLKERWVREWLLGVAAAELVDSTDGITFRLPPHAVDVLTNADGSLLYAGAALGPPVDAGMVDDLAEAFRTGLGLAYDRRGATGAHQVERGSAPWTRLALVQQFVPLVDGLAQRLRAGAEVADVGCGAAVTLITLARAFPNSRFVGYDPSTFAIARGRENVAAAGVANVTLLGATADALPGDRSIDVALTFDCLHDMPHPAATLDQIRGALKDDGVLLVKEIRSANSFSENRKIPVLAMLYGFSLVSCMSSSLSEPDGAGLGTLGLPPDALRAMVSAAGFTRFAVHDIGDPTNLYYEVRP